MPHVEGHNLVTCHDGSQADSYDQCPDISQEWTMATDVGLGTEGWTQPAWWDDPDTTEQNEYQEYIYRLYGSETTGYPTVEEFWDKHGDMFPTWEEAGFEKRYENVLEQLGMLNTSIEMANTVYNLELDKLDVSKSAKLETALTQREGLGRQVESQFMGTGGVVSGRRIEATEEAGENINQALSLELRGINIGSDLLTETYRGDLIDIEDKRLNYENELVSLEDEFEKKLVNFRIANDIAPVKEFEIEFEKTCGDDGGVMVGGGEYEDAEGMPTNVLGDCVLPHTEQTCIDLGCAGGCIRSFSGEPVCADPTLEPSDPDDFYPGSQEACEAGGGSWEHWGMESADQTGVNYYCFGGTESDIESERVLSEEEEEAKCAGCSLVSVNSGSTQYPSWSQKCGSWPGNEFVPCAGGPGCCEGMD